MIDALGRYVYMAMSWLHGILGSDYILTVILFTVLLRLIMSPFDIISRKSTQRSTAAQPYIQKIQKRYAGNPQLMQKKMKEFNKKHHISLMSGCLPLLLTWPLFIIFLRAMNYWGYVENINLLVQVNAGNLNFMAENYSWAWIHNIWAPDSGFSSVIMSAADFAKIPFDNLTPFFSADTLEFAKNAAANGGAIYSTTMQPLLDMYAGYSNGWFILPLASGGFMMLQGYITTKMNKSMQAQGAPGMGMGMNIFMAVFSAWICLSYNSLFSIYWITSNVCGIALTLLLKKIMPPTAISFEEELE
mgnify:CR=1 FL=1